MALDVSPNKNIMWTVPKEFTVKLGGNYYVNTPNMIVANGENIFRLKRREEDGLLAVDFDVYAEDGSKVATIRNGNVVQGDAEKYEFHKEHHRYWVVDRDSGRTICDVRKSARAEDGSELEVSVDLYTKSKFHLMADPDKTNIGGMVMTGCTMKDCGAGIVVN